MENNYPFSEKFFNEPCYDEFDITNFVDKA